MMEDKGTETETENKESERDRSQMNQSQTTTKVAILRIRMKQYQLMNKRNTEYWDEIMGNSELVAIVVMGHIKAAVGCMLFQGSMPN